jgi:5-formyltetrahydrofolate cyclo-ligase
MKATLRKQLRSRRRSLGAVDHAHRSRLAAKSVAGLPGFRAGNRIALYLPFDRETDTSALIAAARRRGVRVFVRPSSTRPLERFYPLGAGTQRSAFGIAVPHCSFACATLVQSHRRPRSASTPWEAIGMGGGF